MDTDAHAADTLPFAEDDGPDLRVFVYLLNIHNNSKYITISVDITNYIIYFCGLRKNKCYEKICNHSAFRHNDPDCNHIGAKLPKAWQSDT